jgi:putative copper export protein
MKDRLSHRWAYWWIGFNVIGLIAWTIAAWVVWPWPNYGYCDFFPPPTWKFLVATIQGIVWMLEAIVLCIVGVRAIKRRDVVSPLAVLATTVLWFSLSRHDFNPNAIPGDGCFPDTLSHSTH